MALLPNIYFLGKRSFYLVILVKTHWGVKKPQLNSSCGVKRLSGQMFLHLKYTKNTGSTKSVLYSLTKTIYHINTERTLYILLLLLH